MNRSRKKSNLPIMAFSALGVVYGDIGTSPLYTLQAAFSDTGLEPTPVHVLGVLSMICWSLILVVSTKYLGVVLRANDKGEGGILTLMSIAYHNAPAKIIPAIMLLGLIGGGFFYGEVIITPAMSVLSAVEGLEVLTPQLQTFVLPIAIGIICCLFLIQKHGSAKMGKLFGPIMVIWFVTIGLLGIMSLCKNPDILAAINPFYAFELVQEKPWLSFIVLGAVVLAITGTEALYADLGHFGLAPIRLAWFALVLPALLLNYFGQGAMLLLNTQAVNNPFFNLAPQVALLPLIILATVATVVASQAVISGVFSLTHQAMQLGYLPLLRVYYTSEKLGQIFVPLVNRLLFIAVIIVILNFHSSKELAAAYGIAVTGTMTITSLLICCVAWRLWKWPLPIISLSLLAMLSIDLSFLGSNIMKIPQGGWLPLLIGLIVFTLMSTWRKGSQLLLQHIYDDSLSLTDFVKALQYDPPIRIDGTAVFMAKSSKHVPRALLHNLKHNQVIHDKVIVMTVLFHSYPYIDQSKRVDLTEIGSGFYRVVGNYGFKETPDLHEILDYCQNHNLKFHTNSTSFFLSSEVLRCGTTKGFAKWRKVLYIWMSRNALRTTDFFRIPINRIVELGVKIEF